MKEVGGGDEKNWTWSKASLLNHQVHSKVFVWLSLALFCILIQLQCPQLKKSLDFQFRSSWFEINLHKRYIVDLDTWSSTYIWVWATVGVLAYGDTWVFNESRTQYNPEPLCPGIKKSIVNCCTQLERFCLRNPSLHLLFHSFKENNYKSTGKRAGNSNYPVTSDHHVCG